jgi:hypothetical protein
VQPGLAVAFPINPGVGFGSVLGSVAFVVDTAIALTSNRTHTSR